MRRFFLASLVAFALVAAACSDDAPTDTAPQGVAATTQPDATASTTTAAPTTTAATTSTTSTTTVPETTSTTAAETTTTTDLGPVSPLNGLPVEDESLLDRRVMSIKIDNHPQARPQSGLLDADMVVEILVEGGFTRFISIFHSAASDYLGPVRSGRPTDAGILRPLDGVFAISGAQNWVARYLVARSIRIMGEGIEGLFRIGSRLAPHNLYADTEGLRNAADNYGFDDEFGLPLYDVAPWAETPGESATELELSWDEFHTVRWEFRDGKYYRYEGSREHTWISGRDGTPHQVAVDVLVVLVGQRYTAYPPAGVSGSPVPATDTEGSGNAYIFFDGTVMRGTWQRDGIGQMFHLTAEDGTTMSVPPGKPWVSIFPDSRTLDFS